MKTIYTLLLLAVVCFSSCKKDSSYDNLSNAILKKEGVLRVECNNCEIKYNVQSKDFATNVKEGSNDIAFYYSSDFDLKTQLISKETQNIRLMVIDSYGRIVSNELSNCTAGEVRVKSFNINIK